MKILNLVESIDHLTLSKDGKRVRCSITGHEMTSDVDVVKSYLKSKKLHKMKEMSDYNFDKLAPYVIPHNRDESKMFCVLTKEKIDRIPSVLEKHVNGKRFKRLRIEADNVYNRRKRAAAARELKAQQHKVETNARGIDGEKLMSGEDDDSTRSEDESSEQEFWISPNLDEEADEGGGLLWGGDQRKLTKAQKRKAFKKSSYNRLIDNGDLVDFLGTDEDYFNAETCEQLLRSKAEPVIWKRTSAQLAKDEASPRSGFGEQSSGYARGSRKRGEAPPDQDQARAQAPAPAPAPAPAKDHSRVDVEKRKARHTHARGTAAALKNKKKKQRISGPR